jgi:hypothetical protein
MAGLHYRDTGGTEGPEAGLRFFGKLTGDFAGGKVAAAPEAVAGFRT